MSKTLEQLLEKLEDARERLYLEECRLRNQKVKVQLLKGDRNELEEELCRKFPNAWQDYLDTLTGE